METLTHIRASYTNANGNSQSLNSSRPTSLSTDAADMPNVKSYLDDDDDDTDPTTSTNTVHDENCTILNSNDSKITNLSSLRCGDISTTNISKYDTTKSEQIITNYLQEQEHHNTNASPSSTTTTTTNLPKFHIQGWRWHTLSLVRDSARLEKLCNKFQHSNNNNNNNHDDTNNNESLTKAINHVMDFNLKGLQRIEEHLFFPWMREKLVNGNTSTNNSQDNKIQNAFEQVIDAVDHDRKYVDQLSKQVQKQIDIVTSTKDDINTQQRQQAISKITNLTTTFNTITKSIYNRENNLLVPAIAHFVSEREQKSFNNKVLRKLGLFESRVHLVGMYEAVWDDGYGNEKERELFVEAIPKLPRMMISRWKRTLYDPQAGILDE